MSRKDQDISTKNAHGVLCTVRQPCIQKLKFNFPMFFQYGNFKTCLAFNFPELENVVFGSLKIRIRTLEFENYGFLKNHVFQMPFAKKLKCKFEKRLPKQILSALQQQICMLSTRPSINQAQQPLQALANYDHHHHHHQQLSNHHQ